MGASLNVICKNAWNFKGKFLTQLTPIVQASLSTLAVLYEKIASIPTLFPFELKDYNSDYKQTNTMSSLFQYDCEIS